MSHKNKESMVYQVKRALDERLRIGESKFAAKQDGTFTQGIYSWKTYENYLYHACRFARYCRSEYHARTVSDCRQYVADYLRKEGESKSAWTVKLEASALAKLYGCSTVDFQVTTSPRLRENITRSRGSKMRDRHFSEGKNKDLVSFCRSTGLRRSELESLRGNQLIYDNGKYYIHVRGKGGRWRDAVVIGDVATVVNKMKNAKDGKVWPHVHAGADIHSYRSDYATALYRLCEREYDTCRQSRFWNPEHRCADGTRGGWDQDAIYHLRGTYAGQWRDKLAMLICSRNLGHNRISVVAEHYIRDQRGE